MKFFSKATGWVRGFFSGIRLSQTARRILYEEELLGEKITNRVRYFFGFLALGPTIAIVLQAGVPAGIAVNCSAFALYFGITVAHTVVLTRSSSRIRERFRYLVTFMDVLIITVIIAFWTSYKSADAPAFALKNPSLYFFTLVIIAPILQYRFHGLPC